MCVVSMVGDHYGDRWRDYTGIYPSQSTSPIEIHMGVSRKEFDDLKREVEEMHELLRAAKRIDEATGQADCESDGKVAILRKVAELVGVDLSDVFPESAE